MASSAELHKNGGIAKSKKKTIAEQNSQVSQRDNQYSGKCAKTSSKHESVQEAKGLTQVEDVSVPKDKDSENGLQKKPNLQSTGTEEDVKAYIEERVDEPSSEELSNNSYPRTSTCKIVKCRLSRLEREWLKANYESGGLRLLKFVVEKRQSGNIGDPEVTNEHPDQETQPNEDDNEFPDNNDVDDYASPTRDSPSHSG
ncbi:hypothetical protein Tco_1001216 [Tanacetum coccineum]